MNDFDSRRPQGTPEEPDKIPPLPEPDPEALNADVPPLPSPKRRAALLVQRIFAFALCLLLIFGIGKWMKMVLNKSAAPEEGPTVSEPGGLPPGALEPTAIGEAGQAPYAQPPLFPVTATDSDVIADRTVTVDLSPLPEGWFLVPVTEDYRFASTGDARTVQVLVPFVDSLQNLLMPERVPVLSADGQPLTGTLLPGPIIDCNTREDYTQLLADDRYQQLALNRQYGSLTPEEVDALLAQEVTLYTLEGYTRGDVPVYTLEDDFGDDSDEQLNPVFRVAAQDASRVLGCSMASWGGHEDGSIEYTAFPFGRQKQQDSVVLPALAVLGGPLEQTDCALYPELPVNEHAPAEGMEPIVAVTTETLDSLVTRVAADAIANCNFLQGSTAVEEETVLQLARQTAALLIAEDGSCWTPEAIDSLTGPFLESLLLTEPAAAPRLWYLQAELTIPPIGGGQLRVVRPMSPAFFEENTPGGEDLGFAFAQQLGSSVQFDDVVFRVLCPEPLTIVDNTLGIDPAEDIWESRPNPGEDRWTLRVSVPDEVLNVPDGAPIETVTP